METKLNIVEILKDKPGFFEKFDSTWNNPYHIMNRRSMTDFAFKQCIPYEGNESLLGTTKDVED